MTAEVPWPKITARIAERVGRPLEKWSIRSQGGGCINASYILTNQSNADDCFFVKVNDAACVEMFSAEAEALAEIGATDTIRVPAPICHGTAGHAAFLVLEFIRLKGGSSSGSQKLMGTQLAALHQVTSKNGNFGWHRDNAIGATPQHNAWHENWSAFYAEKRLGFQLQLAEEKGRSFRSGGRLLEIIPRFFDSYSPRPSLLHGDLWGGNAACDPDDNPVLFDPATYYGDRETDIAFTEMFGGFSGAFYDAYHKSFPLDPGYPRRKQLYNLYHVLNHFNLFGGGYASQAERILDDLITSS